MKTEDLINALIADLTVSKMRFRWIFGGAIALGAVIAAVLFHLLIGVRPDIGQAAESARFLFKFIVTIGLAITAAGLLSRLAIPGVPSGPWRWAWLSVAETPGIERQILFKSYPLPVDRSLGVYFACVAARRADRTGARWSGRGTCLGGHCGGALCVSLHRRQPAVRGDLVFPGDRGRCAGRIYRRIAFASMVAHMRDGEGDNQAGRASRPASV